MFLVPLTSLTSVCKGNNGLAGFNFGPSQFQNLLFLAGYDPAQAPFSAPCGSDTGCVLPFMGKVRDGELFTLFIFDYMLITCIRSELDCADN